MKIEIILPAILLFLIIILMITIPLFVLNNFVGVFKDCENNPDDYVVNFGNQNITCGDLKKINSTIAANEYG
ncbi:MAG: hypothetical protein EHM47_00865 [Ignavibacteriales bacterium]|nr:MAG: hypothetical protein EHM47_00865 [Ignavibacteriales bacterium]